MTHLGVSEYRDLVQFDGVVLDTEWNYLAVVGFAGELESGVAVDLFAHLEGQVPVLGERQRSAGRGGAAASGVLSIDATWQISGQNRTIHEPYDK